MPETKRFPIICGPTASGKSSLGFTLAESHPIEIISADSRQVVKYLDLGTAKPTKTEQAALPVHLINLIEPGERYSAVQFVTDCDLAIEDILARGKIPVVIGGTGLYLRALTEGVVVIDCEVGEIRKKLEAEAESLGSDLMHQKLAEIDPEEAARIHPNNLRRVLRALEIFHQTGQIKSELVRSGAYKRSKFQFESFCLAPEREKLYDRINTRVEQMLESGWLDEIRRLIGRAAGNNSDPICTGEALRAAAVIGYAELLDYLDEIIGYEEAVRLIKQNTRRFAKRQLTWYRNSDSISLFDNAPDCLSQLERLLKAGRS